MIRNVSINVMMLIGNHKSHVYCHGIQPGPSRWETDE